MASKKLQQFVGVTLLVALLAALVLVIAWLLVQGFNLTGVHEIAGFIISWGAWGPFVIVLLHIIAALTGIIPSYPITLLAGGIWGSILGSIYSLIGLQIGASLSFLITRHAAHPWIDYFFKKHTKFYRNIDDRYVTPFIFISRLLPFFVFELISYGAGLTKISFKHYFWATFFGLIPMTILIAYSGKVAFAEGGPILIILTTLSVLLLVFFPWFIEKYNPWGWKEKLQGKPKESKEDAK